MLGQKVYFCDMVSESVKEGVALSETITQTGYRVWIVLSEGVKKSPESSMVFETREEAEEKLNQALPRQALMKSIQKECEEKLDRIRKEVIGEPEFKEVADAIFGKKN